MAEETENLERRIDNLENKIDGRLLRLEGKVNSMDNQLCVFAEVVERGNVVHDNLTKSIDKLADVTIEVEKTMIQMQGEIKANTEKVIMVQDRIGNLEKKVGGESEKNKIDMRTIGKNLILYVLSGGFLITVIFKLIDLIK